jgi:replication-associated recombination protein RarA
MEWFRQYGFSYNPLTTNVQETIQRGLFTAREEELALLQEFVDSGEMVLVTGEPGVGKTTLIGNAHYLNREKYNSFFVMCSEHPEFDVLPSVQARRTIVERLMRKPLPEKENIFFLNETKFLDRFTGESLKTQAKDKTVVKSVICACVHEKDMQVDEAFLDRVGDRIIRLKRLTRAQSEELLNKRLGSRNMFSADAIDILHRASRGNPRHLLEKAEIAAINHAPRKITARMLEKII